MSQPSNWPLPAGSSRIVLPLALLQQLAEHPLSQHLYPLSYGHYMNAAGHAVQRDQHTDSLLIFCHQGHGDYRTAHAQGRLQAGQLLLLPAGISHHYQASSAHPWSIYWVHFSGTAAAAIMPLLGVSNAQPVLNLSGRKQLLPLVTDLLNLQHQPDNLTTALLAAGMLQRLVLELPRLTIQQLNKDFDFARLERFIHDNSHRDVSLHELAAVAGLSPYHFSKRFKASCGTSPMRYVNQFKVRQACQLLDNSTDSIRHIALSLGFDDPYYFSRLFKKTMGMSPQHYRASQQSLLANR
jgi:AraC-like DNA-binding protein